MALAAGAAVTALGIGAFGKAAVEAAIFGDKASFAFKTLMKGSGNAEDQLKRVQDLAIKLGLPMQATIQSFQELLAAKFTPKGAEDIVRLAADMRAVGASAQKVDQVMLAIRQVASKPALSFEELNQQLSEAGIATKAVLEELAKIKGVSVPQIDKMIRGGKISGAEGIEAIKKAVMATMGIKTLGEAGENFAMQTLEGMAGVFRARISKLFMDLGKSILPTLRVLFERFTQFADALMPDLTALFGDIGKALADIFGTEDAKTAFGFIIADIKNLIGIVRGAIPIAQGFIEGFLEGFTAVQGPLREFMKSFTEATGGDNKSTIETITTAMRYLGIAVGAVAAAFGFVFVAATRVLSVIESIIAKINSLKATMNGLTFGALDALSGPDAGAPQAASFGLGTDLAGFGGSSGMTNNNNLNSTITVNAFPSAQEIATMVRREIKQELLSTFGGAMPV
jgi:tape measure domain-containing protein